MNRKELLIRLLSIGEHDKGLTRTVQDTDIYSLLNEVRAVFLAQPPLVEISAPVKVCGDLHGQYSDLIRLFHKGGFPPSANYIFLGDYVDRGKQNLEVILLLFTYKVLYPKNFFLLRGNHETRKVNELYGFYEEVQRRFQSVRLWQAFQDVFCVMPLVGLISDRILCMHGGLSPHLESLDQLRNITRPTEATGETLERDLLWTDPVVNQKGYEKNRRGASWGFGSDVVFKMCTKLNIDLVARAHQVVQDGYEFFANRQCVTIFSAPHYCGQFDNSAAIMNVDQNLQCSFDMFCPADGPQEHPKEVETRMDNHNI